MTGETNHGDTTVSLHALDSTSYLETMVISFTFRFDDVLDEQYLEGSLEKLVQIKNWNKLGARLRRRRDHRLEYVIPPTFTKEQPGIAFSHQPFDVSIDEHPLACRLPFPANVTETFEDMEGLDPIIRPEGAPMTLEDMMRSETPQLFIHVTSFLDATLLTLRWPHTLWDAAGQADFMKAWIAVLDGREEDVQEVYGYYQDPLASIPATKELAKQYVLHHQLLKGVSTLLFIVSLIFKSIFYPRYARRVLRLDKQSFDSIYAGVQQEIAAQEDPNIFVSESDVLLAWWTRVLTLAHRVPTTKPVNVYNVLSFRRVLPDCFPPGKAYLGNAVITPVTQFGSAREILDASVAQTALRLRRSLQQQATAAQVRASISNSKQGSIGFFEPWNAFSVLMSSWHKYKFYDVDFSAAVVKVGAPLEKRKNKKGQPSYFCTCAHVNSIIDMQNAGSAMGKDPEGNWWIYWILSKVTWEEVARLVREQTNKSGLQK